MASLASGGNCVGKPNGRIQPWRMIRIGCSLRNYDRTVEAAAGATFDSFDHLAGVVSIVVVGSRKSKIKIFVDGMFHCHVLPLIETLLELIGPNVSSRFPVPSYTIHRFLL